MLDPARRQLTHVDRGLVDMPARAFDVLVCLVKNPGAPISRRELLDTAWQGTVVDENNLTKAITALRTVLGDELILTVPRQGYQFVVPVETVSQAASVAIQSEARPSEGHSAPSTAKIRWSRWVGAAVALLMLFYAGRSINGYLGQTRVELDAPVTATAENHYQRGLEFSLSNLDRQALELAARAFRQALDVDPEYVSAQIALAATLRQLGELSMEPAEIDRYRLQADAAFARAAEMADDSASGLSLAVGRLLDVKDWAGAEASLNAWLAREPDGHAVLFSYGRFMLRVGRIAEAVDAFERAHAALPDDLATIDMLSLAHNAAGHFDRVIELNAIARQHIGYSRINGAPIFWTLLKLGRTAEARGLFFDPGTLANEYDSDTLLAAVANREPPPELDVFDRMFFLSALYLDRPEDARRELAVISDDPELDSMPDFLNFAMFAAHFDAVEMSLASLDRIETGEAAILDFIWLAHMQKIREQPAFAGIVERLGLAAYWDGSAWPEKCQRLENQRIACD